MYEPIRLSFWKVAKNATPSANEINYSSCMRIFVTLLAPISVLLFACGGGAPRVNYANGEGTIRWVYERVARPALEEGVEAQHVFLEITNPSGTERVDTHVIAYSCEDTLPSPGSPATRISARCWWAGAGSEVEVFELEERGDACAIRTRDLDAGAEPVDGVDTSITPWRVLEDEIPCPPRTTSIQSLAATGPDDAREDGEIMIDTEAPHPTDDGSATPTPTPAP